jgi:hypothetical protein
MIKSPVGLGTKKHCAGEGQQQFTGPEINHYYPQGPTIVGTGNGTPEVSELPSAWGFSWATLSPGVINTER